MLFYTRRDDPNDENMNTSDLITEDNTFMNWWRWWPWLLSFCFVWQSYSSIQILRVFILSFKDYCFICDHIFFSRSHSFTLTY